MNLCAALISFFLPALHPPTAVAAAFTSSLFVPCLPQYPLSSIFFLGQYFLFSLLLPPLATLSLNKEEA